MSSIMSSEKASSEYVSRFYFALNIAFYVDSKNDA